MELRVLTSLLLLLSLLIASEGQTTPPGQVCTQRIDLLFLIDSSGSIRDSNVMNSGFDNWEAILNFTIEFVSRLTIGPDNTRVGLIRFGNVASTQFSLNTHDNGPAVINAIRNLVYVGGFTNTQAALNLVPQQLTAANGDRPDVPNVVVVITDGVSTVLQNETIPAAVRVRASGANIIAFGITNQINETELRLISSPPQVRGQNYFRSPNFTDIQRSLDQIVTQTCVVTTPVPPPTSPTPFSECTQLNADIFFVVDGSGSIRDNNVGNIDNWELVRRFLRELVRSFDIDNDLVRVGLVVFADIATRVWDLNTYSSVADMVTAINTLGYPGGNTNTFQGLNKTVEGFNVLLGDRPDVPDIAIIVTDGVPTRNVEDTIPEANKMHALGIRTFAVGVSNRINETVLRLLSSPPRQLNQNYFRTPNFAALSNVTNVLLARACETPAPTTPMVTPALIPDCRLAADIIFVVDASGSIGDASFAQQKDFLVSVVNDLNIDNGQMRVGLLTFSTGATVQFQLNTHTTRQAAAAAIMALTYSRGTTNTGEALRVARDVMLTAANGDRAGVQNVIVVLTDGGSNDKSRTVREARLTKASAGAPHVVVLGVGRWTDPHELRAIASWPASFNMIPVANFSSLALFRSQIQQIVCNHIDECVSNPCRNQGNCIDGIGYFLCNCTGNFAGEFCQQTCRVPSETVFALDGSGSVTRPNFEIALQFVMNVVNDLPIDSLGVRFGLEWFSDIAQIQFNMSDYSTKAQLLNAISSTIFPSGTTNTAEALRMMREVMFSSAAGNTAALSDVGIVMTDGRSNNFADTLNQAIQTQNAGIELATIGVGSNLNPNELFAIASSSNLQLNAANFSVLSSLRSDVLDIVCNNNNSCGPNNPCLNGGTCRDFRGGFGCDCVPGFSGPACSRRCSSQADILFIIDRSGSIQRERFNVVQNYVNGVLDQLNVDDGSVQVAAVAFSDTAAVEFPLNRYRRRRHLQAAINAIQFAGGRTNAADALTLASTQVFTTAGGDRTNVPNYIIFFSDGNSNINKNQTITAAINNKISGMHTISVSVGENLNFMELRGVASDPSTRNVLNVNSFSNLQSLILPTINSMCNDVNDCEPNPCQNGGICEDRLGTYECTCGTDNTGQNCEHSCSRQQDVVFVLDLSGSVERLHMMIIEITRRLIWALDMRMDRARVALISFSDSARVHFLLNTYQQKADVMAAMVFGNVGGRTNTQAALQLVDEQALQAASGDRTSVPNRVVVFTDGGSNIEREMTVPRADTLRNRGAQVYAVAVGNSTDLSEINGVADSPRAPWVTLVPSEADIGAAVDSILTSLCN